MCIWLLQDDCRQLFSNLEQVHQIGVRFLIDLKSCFTAEDSNVMMEAGHILAVAQLFDSFAVYFYGFTNVYDCLLKSLRWFDIHVFINFVIMDYVIFVCSLDLKCIPCTQVYAMLHYFTIECYICLSLKIC